jgi:hypothetical protein
MWSATTPPLLSRFYFTVKNALVCAHPRGDISIAKTDSASISIQ